MLQVTITKDDFTPAVREGLARLADLQPFLMVWGQSTAKTARETARAKGGRRFWRAIAMSTQVRAVSADAVSVFSTHIAAGQKQYGGTISAPGKGPGAKGARALTIPIGEARGTGRTAAEYELGGRELFVIRPKSGDPDTRGILGYSGAGGEFVALFALRRRVTQQPDPWFPLAPEILATGEAEAERFLRRALA